MTSPQFLNDPPMMPSSQSALGAFFPSSSTPPSDFGAMQAAEAAFKRVAQMEVPVIESSSETTVELPAGWLAPNGMLVKTARVRELNGFDEEKLARLNATKNPGVFVTELLLVGVEELGGDKPTRQQLQSLLIGDRDALLLGVRRATYGSDVEFTLDCEGCNEKSTVTVDITTDVEVVKLDDPLLRVFSVDLRHGSARVQLMNGVVQESVGDLPSTSTMPELNTLLLQKCVIELNGVPISSGDDIRNLSASDRATLVDFITEHAPGPKLGEVKIPCATCGREYPAPLHIGNLFRFR